MMIRALKIKFFEFFTMNLMNKINKIKVNPKRHQGATGWKSKIPITRLIFDPIKIKERINEIKMY